MEGLECHPMGFEPWPDAWGAIRAVFKQRQDVNRAKFQKVFSSSPYMLRPHRKAIASRECWLPKSNAISWPSLSSAVIEGRCPFGWVAHLPLTFPISSGHKKGTKSQERNCSSPLACSGDTHFKSLVVSTEPFPSSSAKELSSQESLQTGQLQRGPRRRHHRTSQGLRSSAVQEGAQPMHFYLFVVSP